MARNAVPLRYLVMAWFRPQHRQHRQGDPGGEPDRDRNPRGTFRVRRNRDDLWSGGCGWTFICGGQLVDGSAQSYLGDGHLPEGRREASTALGRPTLCPPLPPQPGQDRSQLLDHRRV
jgi:hypothetical protein